MPLLCMMNDICTDKWHKETENFIYLVEDTVPCNIKIYKGQRFKALQ